MSVQATAYNTRSLNAELTTIGADPLNGPSVTVAMQKRGLAETCNRPKLAARHALRQDLDAENRESSIRG